LDECNGFHLRDRNVAERRFRLFNVVSWNNAQIVSKIPSTVSIYLSYRTKSAVHRRVGLTTTRYYRISRISVPRKCTLKMSDEYSKMRKNGQRTYQSWVRQIILLLQLHDNYVDTNTLLLTPKFTDVDVLLTALFLS
jgi:hypothetical protein